MESVYIEKRAQVWAPSKDTSLPPIAYLPDFQVLDGKTPYLQKETPKPAVDTTKPTTESANPYIPSPEKPQLKVKAEPLIVVDKA